MLYGAQVAVCFEINTKHINAVWAERIIPKCQTCWCTKPVVFKRLMFTVLHTSQNVITVITVCCNSVQNLLCACLCLICHIYRSHIISNLHAIYTKKYGRLLPIALDRFRLSVIDGTMITLASIAVVIIRRYSGTVPVAFVRF
jgi:hypothetical protein